ncbi:MAG: Gldg family protein, partial [Alphaproteobacteria bacterium]|nr:Gldg family protein [Alphaproteobacteria bacterium]
DLVWGKFFAALTFCSTALILTFPFVITLNILGSPDNGIILNSYLGFFLLSGAMLAISQTASALSKNQVVALVIAVLFNLVFYLSGLEYILSIIRIFTPDYIVNLIASFSFLTHASDFYSGVFSLHSFLFLITLIIFFNFLTEIIISFKTSGTASWLNTKSSFGCILAAFLLFCAFIGFNLFSETIFKPYQIDATAENLFSLSSSSKEVLTKLKFPVRARLYYSPILGKRNEQYRENFETVTYLLKAYQSLSDGNFNFKIYNPEPLSDTEDRALQAGLQPIPVEDLNTAAYFGITFSNENGKTTTIPFLPLQRQKFLEQDLTESIYLLDYQKKKLGLITSLPLLGYTIGNRVRQPWQIIKELQKYYDIIPINTSEQFKNIDILMIAHPQNLSVKMQEDIYNYSITGGKILAFFDIAPEALSLSGPIAENFTPSDYGDLPQKWGFRFFSNSVIADLGHSTQTTVETADYNGTSQDLIQFYITPENFFNALYETKGLKRLLTTSASVFMPLKNAPIYFAPLIQATQQSQLLPSTVVTQKIHPSEILRAFKADSYPKYLAAHILSKSATAPFELIVVGDTDLLYDSFWTTSFTLGKNYYNIPLLDNANFVLNALDVLSKDFTLIELRGKSPKLRPFTKIEQKQKQIAVDFKIKEKDIFDKITKSKKGLQELLGKRSFENRLNFTPEELSLINKLKKDLQQNRHDLFTIRKELNTYMEQTELLIKIFNIYTIPALMIIGLLILKLKKNSFNKPSPLILNKKFAILATVAAICLSLGFGTVLLLSSDNKAFVEENQLLFPALSSQINNVNKISFKNHKQSLTFSKQDTAWVLEDNKEFMVNQNRITGFLSALIRATIFEKKSESLENLNNFGLLPIDNPDSTATQITLSQDENNILDFTVGNYDIELGRGTIGAYIRLPKDFKVWLAQIDLIDLDLDYHYWTYSNLWTLEFGRFASINGNKNRDTVAKLVSLFLNTKLEQPTSEKPKNKYMEITTDGEYFNNMQMIFYQSGTKFYVQYQFNDVISNELLHKFALNIKGKYFEINAKDMEKIKNVLHQ